VKQTAYELLALLDRNLRESVNLFEQLAECPGQRSDVLTPLSNEVQYVRAQAGFEVTTEASDYDQDQATHGAASITSMKCGSKTRMTCSWMPRNAISSARSKDFRRESLSCHGPLRRKRNSLPRRGRRLQRNARQSARELPHRRQLWKGGKNKNPSLPRIDGGPPI
jgi:hypothetical protein